MIVMPSNNVGFQAGKLFGTFPGRLAHLMTTDNVMEPKDKTPWALDNGCYAASLHDRTWSERNFYIYLDKYAVNNPIWVVVPDKVGDKNATLELWERHASVVAAYGVPLAFAAQDGMTPGDVPGNADIVFLGGTTSWKWNNLTTFTSAFPRVHVGRVNTYRLLWIAHKGGAESCDGTGWFRGDHRQLDGLWQYLRESENGGMVQLDMGGDDGKSL